MLTREEVLKAENMLLHAMHQSDLEKLDALLFEDLLFTIPNGQTITKEIDLNAYASGEMNITKIEASNLQMNLLENVAVVSVNVHMEGSYASQPMDGDYKIIRVWKQFQDGLKVIAGSSIML